MNKSSNKNFDPFAPFQWRMAHGKSLELGPSGVLMGIINVTPDSFSDGGRHESADAAVKQALKLQRQGARIVDIGGESTRPGATEISAETEQERILPVIEKLAGHPGLILSVDTWRSQTADLAISAGAHIINDVWGFQRDREIAQVVAKHSAACVIMHTGRERNKHRDVIDDQKSFLGESLSMATSVGIPQDSIVLDPGFGFAKDADENLELLHRFEELFSLGQPVLTGTSRKRFIGAVTGRSPSRRDVGTAATTVVARMKGSAVFRVHDVPKNLDALRLADAVLEKARN